MAIPEQPERKSPSLVIVLKREKVEPFKHPHGFYLSSSILANYMKGSLDVYRRFLFNTTAVYQPFFLVGVKTKAVTQTSGDAAA